MRSVEYPEESGQRWRIAETIGLAPLIRFGKRSKMGMQLDMESLSVMSDVLEQCFPEESYCAACESTAEAALSAPVPAEGEYDERCCTERRVVVSEYERYMDYATAHRWGEDDLFGVIKPIMSEITKRPTGRPSDSGGGPSNTNVSSEDDSSLRAQRRLEESGRADLAVAVLQRREFLKAV